MAHKSKVKWFDGKKGFGFIEHPEGGSDIFVHYSAIMSDKQYKMLEQGEPVEFDLITTNKGPQAQNVRTVGAVGV